MLFLWTTDFVTQSKLKPRSVGSIFFLVDGLTNGSLSSKPTTNELVAENLPRDGLPQSSKLSMVCWDLWDFCNNVLHAPAGTFRNYDFTTTEINFLVIDRKISFERGLSLC